MECKLDKVLQATHTSLSSRNYASNITGLHDSMKTWDIGKGRHCLTHAGMSPCRFNRYNSFKHISLKY